MLAVCLAGLTAVSMQVRCIDAAREAVRLAARGDDGSTVARAIAPAQSAVDVRRDGKFVVAKVTARSALLPGLEITGAAMAAAELDPG